MASPYQQQAFQRKLIYLGCILVLFTGSWSWRHYLLRRTTGERTLGVRESSLGDVELSGQMLRLMLTGSRGLFTSCVWWISIEKQKKNQWNELDTYVRTLTRLQPHFIRPWLFQSWNLSYNVSVALDRPADKYFYIARGIELLAEGERQNHDNPYIRWNIAFYYQQKITLHDDTNVLRSLLQLSTIPPNERDPARFLIVGADGKNDINGKEFEQFCKDHPELIRRLHSGIQRDDARDTKRQFLCQTPEAVVQFLADNYKILSPYETPPAAGPNGWVQKEDRKLDEWEPSRSLPPPPGKEARSASRGLRSRHTRPAARNLATATTPIPSRGPGSATAWNRCRRLVPCRARIARSWIAFISAFRTT